MIGKLLHFIHMVVYNVYCSWYADHKQRKWICKVFEYDYEKEALQTNSIEMNASSVDLHHVKKIYIMIEFYL